MLQRLVNISFDINLIIFWFLQGSNIYKF